MTGCAHVPCGLFHPVTAVHLLHAHSAVLLLEQSQAILARARSITLLLSLRGRVTDVSQTLGKLI